MTKWIGIASLIFLMGCTVTITPFPKPRNEPPHHRHSRSHPSQTPTPAPNRTPGIPRLEPGTKPTPVINMTNLGNIRYL